MTSGACVSSAVESDAAKKCRRVERGGEWAMSGKCMGPVPGTADKLLQALVEAERAKGGAAQEDFDVFEFRESTRADSEVT